MRLCAHGERSSWETGMMWCGSISCPRSEKGSLHTFTKHCGWHFSCETARKQERLCDTICPSSPGQPYSASSRKKSSGLRCGEEPDVRPPATCLKTRCPSCISIAMAAVSTALTAGFTITAYHSSNGCLFALFISPFRNHVGIMLLTYGFRITSSPRHAEMNTSARSTRTTLPIGST